jgi:hypothetical protein
VTGGGASPKTSFRSARGDPNGEAALSDLFISQLT